VVDGVSNAVFNYASVLHENGDDVVVATPRYPKVDYSNYPFKVIAYQSLNLAKLASGYRLGNAFSPEALLELREFKPDIIHSHCPFSSLMMGRHIRLLTKAPLVFTYHTKFDIDIARAVASKTIQHTVIRQMINLISISDEVWTVSKGAGESLLGLGYEGEYHIMPNGVDFPYGQASKDKVLEVTKGYDLPDDIPIYLFVGRMFKYKGLEIITNALKIINEKGHDFRMVFIGDGFDYEAIKKEVAEFNLNDKVFFLGKIEDREVLRAWYTRCNLFLFPSTYDTNGIVVTEAAACAVPAVLVKGSCAAEGVTDKENGFLIEENAESMSKLLLELGNDIDTMNKVGLNAEKQLYISWHDAVMKARNRYEIIINDYKNKKIRHKT